MLRRWRTALAGTVAVLLGGGGAAAVMFAPASSAASLTVAASADTYTRYDAQTSNYGTSVRMSAQGDAGYYRHALVRFNPVTVPDGQQITAAHVRLTVDSHTGSGGVDMYKIAGGWTETGVTWATEPVRGAWLGKKTVTAAGTVLDWDVTSALNATTGTNQLNVKVETGDAGYYGFKTGEGGAAPQLVLTTEPVASPTTSGTPTASPTVTASPTTTSSPTETATPTDSPTTSAPASDEAAVRYGWGSPIQGDEFNYVGAPRSDWSVYDGAGHAGQGIRSPAAWSGDGSTMKVHGDDAGTTGGMSANWPGSDRQFGRWEARMKTSTRDPRYHAVLILWPDDGYANGKCDGEVDYSESTADLTKTHFFLHHGCDNAQTQVAIPNDTTVWHNYAVEWTPTAMVGYIDGVEWFRDSNVADLPPGPMHQTIQLDYFPNDGSGALKPTDMWVDWTREYAAAGSSPTASPTSSTVSPSPTSSTTAPSPTTSAPSPTTSAPSPTTSAPAPAGDVHVAAVGDQNPGSTSSVTSASGKTAAAIKAANVDAYLGLGDFQYTYGTCAAFTGYYEKAGWAGLNPKLYSTAGPTHDFDATNANGQQYSSFMSGTCPGEAGGKTAGAVLKGGTLQPTDFYSFDKGGWHFVQLPSGCYRYAGKCDNAAMISWLNADLDKAVAAGKHIVGFWHEPYWTSATSEHSTTEGDYTKPFVDALGAHGARMIMNGHQHGYQRFNPQTAAGVASASGMQEFVVGTGGIGFYAFTSTAPNTAVKDSTSHGYLDLILHADGSYAWKFVKVDGSFADAGTRAK